MATEEKSPPRAMHPLALLFPPAADADFKALVADIKANGLNEPIVLLEGEVLDGRNRLAACIEAGVAPVFVEFDGDDPMAFVISKNLTRRHLTTSQRAMVAARIATFRLGDNQHTVEGVQNCTPTLQQAAECLGVSRRTAATARAVIEAGDQSLINAVESGALAVSEAEKQVRAPKVDPKPQPPKPARVEPAREPKPSALDDDEKRRLIQLAFVQSLGEDILKRAHEYLQHLDRALIGGPEEADCLREIMADPKRYLPIVVETRGIQSWVAVKGDVALQARVLTTLAERIADIQERIAEDHGILTPSA